MQIFCLFYFRYYHDASRILAQMIFRHYRMAVAYPRSHSVTCSPTPLLPSPAAQSLELRCVVAVVRHGDRTPKQKIKLQVFHPKFLDLFEKQGGIERVEVKLKTPNELQEVLDIVRSLLLRGEVEDCRDKFEQIRFVLEMKGSFSGINRKVELKASKGERPCLDLILKWGGELTGTGRRQAEALGQSFRHLYPLGRNCGPDAQGIGLLRLHSTFRHDLKIYASDEARVQMTAAAFAKGFLALEGELPPILAQMVKSANTNGLLGHSWVAHDIQKPVKERLFKLLKINREFTEGDKTELNPCGSISVARAIERVKNPRVVCKEIGKLLKQLIETIARKRNSGKTEPLYHGETWDFIHRRWRKLFKDFELSSGEYDPSKVPDIYDGIKYDLLHNSDALGFEGATQLFTKVRDLADIIIPQENGMMQDEKIKIGVAICEPLLKKIRTDLQRNLAEEAVYQLDPEYSLGVSTPERHVRTRLYFTSESHIHGLLLVLLHASPWAEDPQWQQAIQTCSTVSELDFLSQIVILLYENPSKEQGAEERFHVEVHFSPGVARILPGGASEDAIQNGKKAQCNAGAPSTQTETDCAQNLALSRNSAVDLADSLGTISNSRTSGADRPIQSNPDAPSHSNTETDARNLATRRVTSAVERADSLDTINSRRTSVMERTECLDAAASRRRSAGMERTESLDADSAPPFIHPLNTLHSALSHTQMDEFLQTTTRLTH